MNSKISIRKMTLIAVLSALAAVVMFFEFPLPFAPPFYEVDFSEVVVLIGTFSLGPVSGVVIEFLKICIKLLVKPTTTVYIGEIANFVVGCCFIVPAGIIYKLNKTKKNAVVGMIVGTLSLGVVASLANWFILLPAYSKLYGMPIEAFIGMGSEVNSFVKDLPTLVIFATLPFNLVKGIVTSLITFIVYKRISPIVRKIDS